ncbi:MAG TPA: hypothetical protein VMQ54_00820 [Steroidobacteraceae bacterium]|nr:hypothetical protein [Steroidobacteraceae bacterium]
MPDANSTAVKIRNFIWISSHVGGIFSAANSILDEKSRPVSAKFNLSGRPLGSAAGRAETRPGRRSKPSINHDGKETELLVAAGSPQWRCGAAALS